MGWNSIHLQNEGRLFKGISQESYVYFVHSYYLKAEEEEIIKATTEYSTHIHASVEKGNLFACQFHLGKEFRSWTCHSEKFCGNWRGGLSDVYKTNYPMPGCKNGRVVKGVNFVDLKDAGDPVEIAKRMTRQEPMKLCSSTSPPPPIREERSSIWCAK